MKKLFIAAVITVVLASCGGNGNSPGNMERNADSMGPAQPDTSMMNTDTNRTNIDSGQMHQNPNYHPDTLKPH